MVPVRRLVATARIDAIVASFATVALLVCALWTCAPGRALAAQPGDALVLHAYTLRYQQAIEAIPLIQPLLTNRGALELQPSGNTLVIRDTQAALARIVPVLRAFDHPAQPIRLEVLIVRASRAVVSPPAFHSDLPEAMTRRLRQLLPYDSYETQAQAELASQEGQAVSYDLGEDYVVSFRVGTLLDAHHVKLSDFDVSHRASNHKPLVPLVHTSINLSLDQTMSLGLARSESSREALMIVVTAHHGDARPHTEP
jgi:hypothetical protein